VKVTFNYAGSQQLAAQLGQGAPADVFTSANTAQMAVAVNAERIAKDTPKTFVLNQLVVVPSPTSKIKVTTLKARTPDSCPVWIYLAEVIRARPAIS
jgi:molybdate transport system substrate-binding protein